ncbi:hypothetical protein P3T36_005659 [Kitasatospora sp. MAP12-15]|uniref:helix-turn-helix domain-containing protein n=1 Tax=unclassified Kitasatospora TaxID=2633591 RepID=UPI00247DBFC0|nr:hypothetical protein [Kitasatospora sp. MAP12-44]
MARRPRPIDPTDGPLQAFAYDLRRVREEAGNPTYRALAGLAGFSATTLSDAAGGVRLPSLEVTLAYVGACGGDATRWESRWRELDRLLESEREAAAPAADPIPEAESPTPEDPAAPQSGAGVFRIESSGGGGELPQPPAWRRPWAPWAAVGAVIVLLVTSLFVVRLSGSGHPVATPTAAAPAAPCPASSPVPGGFPGSTYTVKTNVRAGASLTAAVIQQVPMKCQLWFTGYCLGDVTVDATEGIPDMRWLELSGGGVIASAIIHGNPPSTMQPTPCTDSVPAPSAISLAVAPEAGDADMVNLVATGPQLWLAGFAAYYVAPGGGTAQGPAWHQLGFSDQTQLAAEWRFGTLRADPRNAGPIPVVATACLAGLAPTSVADARLFNPQAPATTQPAVLSPAELAKGEQTACGYYHPG